MAQEEVFIESISKQTFEQNQKFIKDLDEMIGKIGVLNTDMKKAKWPSEYKKVIQDANEEIKKSVKFTSDSEKAQRRLANATSNLNVARSKENKTIQQQRVETNRLNREAREEATLTNQNIGAYQKLNLQRTQAKKTLLDLLAAEKLNNAEIEKARARYLSLDTRVRKADKAVGDFHKNIGNYRSALGGLAGTVRNLVGAFGLLEAGRFILNFTRDSIRLAREARGVEFAFNRIANSAEILDKARESTRGFISDIEIKRSTVQLDNFNLSVQQVNTLLEFATIRATQTGDSVERLVEQITLGLGRQSVQRLDDLGITQARINEEVAKGKDFMQAFVDIAQEEIPKAGSILDDAGDSTQRFNASLTNAKQAFGEIFTTGNFSIIGHFANQLQRVADGLKLFRVALDAVWIVFKNLLSIIPSLDGNLTKLVKIFTTPGITVFSDIIIRTSAVLNGMIKMLKSSIIAFREFFRTLSLFQNINIDPLNPAKTFVSIRNFDFSNAFTAIKNSVSIGFKNVASSFGEGYNDLYKQIRSGNKKVNDEQKKLTNSNTPTGDTSGAREKVSAVLGFSSQDVDLLTDAEKAALKAQEEFAVFSEVLGGFEKGGLRAFMDRFGGIADQAKSNEERIKLLRQATDEFIASLQADFFQESGLPALAQLFDGTFDALFEGADTMQEKFTIAFNAISEVGQQAFNLITQASNQQYETAIANAQQERDIAIMFAGDSASAKEAIEEEYNEQVREIRARQAEAEKRQAMFNTIVNTAQAVVAALPNVPLSILVGALGAAQLAVIASTPVPAFKDGVRDFSGGYALVNDAPGSNYREVITTPDGQAMKPLQRNVLLNLPKGSNVYRNEEEYFNEQLKGVLVDVGVNPFGIGPRVPDITVNGGGNIDYERIEDIMKTTVGGIKSYHTSFDKRGVTAFTQKAHGKKVSLNNRSTLR